MHISYDTKNVVASLKNNEATTLFVVSLSKKFFCY